MPIARNQASQTGRSAYSIPGFSSYFSRYILVIPLLVVCNLLAGQPLDTSCQCPDLPDGFGNTISTKEFRKILNGQFSNLLTGQTNNSIGNFATLDLISPEAKFGGSLILNNGHVLTMSASGGATDGLMAVFSNSKLNTQIALDVQYNFMPGRSRKKMSFETDSGDVVFKKADKIRYDYKLAVNDIRYRIDSFQLEQKITQTNERITTLTGLGTTLSTRIDSLQRGIDSIRAKEDLTATVRDSQIAGAKAKQHAATISRDSLLYLRSKLVLYLADSLTVVKGRLLDCASQCLGIRNKALDDLDKLTTLFPVSGFNINWWSVGYKVKNVAFKYFSPNNPVESQVFDTSFATHELKVQHAWYYWSEQKNKSFYWSTGMSFGYTDNFNTLKKKEITEKKDYGSLPDERSVTSRYNAYQGVYKRHLKELRIYSDYYRFLLKDNVAAFHINPEWVIRTAQKPAANLHIGGLLVFKDSGKAGSIVNAELYYQFVDIFDTGGTDYSLFERNNIGIRFTVPIRFNQKP